MLFVVEKHFKSEDLSSDDVSFLFIFLLLYTHPPHHHRQQVLRGHDLQVPLLSNGKVYA